MEGRTPDNPNQEEPPSFLPPEPPGGYPPTQPPPAQPPPGGFPPPVQPPPGYAYPQPPPPPPPPGWYPPPAPPPPPQYGYGPPPQGYQPYPPHGYGQWPAPQAQQQVRVWRGQRLAGWWARVGAAVLDGLIVLVPATVLTLLFAEIVDPGAVEQYVEEGESLAVTLGGVVMTLLTYLVYKGLTMSRSGARNGQTVGKQLVNIRVVREDAQPVTWGLVATRETLIKGILFGYIAIVTLFIATLLNYLWPLWDDESRALHDMMAHTRVVSTE